MEAKPYSPIDCSFYDRLEAAATLNKTVAISYLNDGKIKELQGIITDLITSNKAEWMVLHDGQRIRLDFIQSLDGIPLDKYC